MGFFFPRIPALAAKVAMGIGIISYITINYLVKFDFHFLYVLACTVLHQRGRDADDRFYQTARHAVHLQRCVCGGHETVENVKIASIGILFAMIGVYAGLAGIRWLRYALVSDNQLFHRRRSDCLPDFDSWRHRHDPAVTFTPDAKDSL